MKILWEIIRQEGILLSDFHKIFEQEYQWMNNILNPRIKKEIE